MDPSLSQQILALLERETNILIALPKNPSTDAIASSLAFFLFLEKLGKRTKIVANNFQLPPNHQFLPKSKEIITDLSSLQKFIITLNLEKTKVEELSYEIAGDKLEIFITPKNGYFSPEDVSTSAGAYEYSLIIVLDSPSLEALGSLFDDNAEFFYHVPIINIDHRATNGHFGQVNCVDLTATSTSEIIFELIREADETLLDEQIATNLLTGIISKTKSFQTASVTPRSLSIASHLVESGARREEIVRNLFQTKSIQALRLWGRALSRLQTEAQGRCVWTTLVPKDFSETQSEESDLLGVIDELIVNTPKAEIIAALYEGKDRIVHASVSTTPTLNGNVLFRSFAPAQLHGILHLTFQGMTAPVAEQTFLSVIRDHYAAPTFPKSDGAAPVEG